MCRTWQRCVASQVGHGVASGLSIASLHDEEEKRKDDLSGSESGRRRCVVSVQEGSAVPADLDFPGLQDEQRGKADRRETERGHGRSRTQGPPRVWKNETQSNPKERSSKSRRLPRG
ncbi:hypothetical protein B0H13DRAFT_1865102 [Mycena leptocephala]|nr:hypothetical protein B0H13DRAFT_1865102 [Mycena leptocephala]